MIKTKSGKILILLIISIVMFNFISTNISFAVPENSSSSSDSNNYKFDSKEMAAANKIDYTTAGGVLSTAVNGIVGLLTIPVRLIIVIVGGVCQFLGTIVGESAGTTESGTFTMVSTEDILFNHLAITDINFFNINSFGSSNKALSGGDSNPIKLLKQNVANWYITLRRIAMIILLVILIYIGIRMAMSSVASEKAAYKKMFKDWAVSLALVFILHYIILLVISVNNVFVNILAEVGKSTLQFDKTGFSNYMSQMVINSMHPLATLGWGATIMYFLMVLLTFIFLIMYIKRMITIAFLILISPVITITYSIDKVGDNKAQAFSAWMKEFFHNVLIQPFHCILYLAFTAISMKLVVTSGSLAASCLAVLTMFFMLQAEGIIKSIFGITSKSTGNALATAAVLSSAYSKLSSGKKDNKDDSSASPARNVKLPTMNSQKNMKAVTAGGSGGATGASTTTKTTTGSGMAKPSSSNKGGNSGVPDDTQAQAERFNQAMAAGKLEAEDYDESMDDKMDPNEKLSLAVGAGQSEDYDNLTNGNDNIINPTPIATSTQQQTGQQIPQQSQTAPQQSNDGVRMKYRPRQRSMGEKVKGLANDYLPGAGMAGAVMGGALAGMAGSNIAETIGAMGVGKRLGQRSSEWASDALKNKKNAKYEKALKQAQAKPYEKQLAGDFIEHKDGKEFNTKRELKKARDYLNMSEEEIENIKDQSEKNYVQSLHSTRNLYRDQYQGEDADERVLETMEKIFDGDIDPWDLDQTIRDGQATQEDNHVESDNN